MDPDEFFRNFVEGNFKDFTEKEGSVRRGFNAAVAAFHMADHYFNYCKRNYPEKIVRFSSRKNFLKYRSRKNPYFSDIHGVANAYKHLYQDTGASHVTISSAGTIESVVIRELEIKWDVVVYLNVKSGKRIRLSEALNSVLQMWENELSTFFND
jgi:hypothetical protein